MRGDTRLLVTDFLCDGLGYDKYEDLTAEYQVKGEPAGYGVRIARQLVAFIEVKRAANKVPHRSTSRCVIAQCEAVIGRPAGSPDSC